MVVAVAALAAPATAAVASPPAVDQYTQHLPGAGGGGTASEDAPTAAPGLLPNSTRQALTDPEGQQLVQIATSPGLGAPEAGRLAKNDGSAGQAAGRGVATVVADTAATTGPSLALIVALAVIAVPGALFLLRRRRSPRHI
jgi:hypothetical protein